MEKVTLEVWFDDEESEDGFFEPISMCVKHNSLPQEARGELEAMLTSSTSWRDGVYQALVEALCGDDEDVVVYL